MKCVRCQTEIHMRNGGWVHILDPELAEQAMIAPKLQDRLDAFLAMTKDHAAEPA